jgi:hypothetical protein
LLFQPAFQSLDDWSAVLLVKGQPLVWVEPLFFGQVFKMINLSDIFNHSPAKLGKKVLDLKKEPAGMQ